MEWYDTVAAPWGTVYVIFNSEGITRICLTQDQFRREFDKTVSKKNHPIASRELVEYFQRKRQHFSIPLVMQGTTFQAKVWKALLDIPYGQTRSYGWIANRIGNPRSNRAVGNAVGANPIPVVVPCHRVIKGDGSLGGYYYGPEMKQQLLDIEKI
jgi:methylated-DNA-[protein]-cysteine S-methyltransferase